MKEYGEQLFIYKLGIYFVIYEWEKSVCFCDEYILFFLLQIVSMDSQIFRV